MQSTMGVKKGDQIVKVLTIMGLETAVLKVVESVKRGVVRCEGDEHLKYDADTGREIDPVIPGCSSRLVPLEK
jgi:hypothetical protein